MAEACRLIATYVAGFTYEAFADNDVVRDAVLYRTLVIGEAVRFISAETLARMPGIPWQNVKRMRNVIVHEYHGIRLAIAWEVATVRAPELLVAVESIRPPEHP